MNVAELTELMLAVRESIEANREYLTDLDRAIGDGDHGINMSKGFRAVAEKLKAPPAADPAALLKTVGMTLISTVGGASGPLYGTAFLRAAAAAGKVGSGGGVAATELGADDAATVLDAALTGIKERGKAVVGDKTIVDALEPAAATLREALAEGRGIAEAARLAAEAAQRGAESTRGFAARKGRASYLGERSIGHQDPGATSTAIMLQRLAEFLAARRS